MIATQEQTSKVTNKLSNSRNGLFELYRFLFALWVVYYHGFFIFKTECFGHGYIAVEFFFILSGFFILSTIEKYDNKSFFAGLFSVLWKRTKSLGLPFIIGIIFVVWYMIIEGQISMLGYLWYIPVMLIAFALIYLLKRILKNKIAFAGALIVCIVVSYLLLYLPVLPGWGLFRALGGVSLGALISLIPQVNWKIKFVNLNWIITALLFAITILLAYLPKTNFTSEYLLIFLLMPALIYFTNTLQVNSKILNFLGSLSFGLYAYQCVLRIIEFYIPMAQYWLFLILIGLVLLDKIVVYSYKKIREKQKLQKGSLHKNHQKSQ